MASGVFRICHDDAGVVRLAKRICCPADREEFVSSADHVSPISDIFRRLVRCIEQSERHLACSSGELGAPEGIDDPASVNGGPHVAVSAGPGNVEQPHSFHKKRTLLGIENGEALVDLNLECVAFHLAEVGIDRRIESDV